MNSNQKEEFRFIFAGMALQVLITKGQYEPYNADKAVKFAVWSANALIAELDKKETRE